MNSLIRLGLGPFIVNRTIHTTITIFNSNMKNRQAKIMRKFLGNRQSGSKKKWYTSSGDDTRQESSSVLSFSKTKKQGKNTSRRIAVLNKLFMENITDLMATGQVSGQIVGKSIEISSVKVTPDFQIVNVYWKAKGTNADVETETVLKRCAGAIQHELSQLRLLGEVPRIHFVRDRTSATLEEVQNILQDCNVGDDHQTQDELAQLKREFRVEDEISETEIDNQEEPLLKMRHDVFGLDHRDITDKIASKMKKLEQAWTKYEQVIRSSPPPPPPPEQKDPNNCSEEKTLLTSSRSQISKAYSNMAVHDEEFEKFLEKQLNRKQNGARPHSRKDFRLFNDCVDEVRSNNSKSSKSFPIADSKLDDGDYWEECEHIENFKS